MRHFAKQGGESGLAKKELKDNQTLQKALENMSIDRVLIQQGSNFMDWDDDKMQEELAKHNQIEKLGDHGYLIEGEKVKWQEYPKKVLDKESAGLVRAELKNIIQEGEDAEQSLAQATAASAKK